MLDKFFMWFKVRWGHYQVHKELKQYLSKYGSTHSCPRCKEWEHEGNIIYTKVYDRETDKRTCSSCGYIWRSHFCPAGHAWLEEYEWTGNKFEKVDHE